VRAHFAWIAAVAFLAGAPGLGSDTEIRHDPPASAVMGEPIPLSVVLEGTVGDVSEVVLYHRLEGSGDYSTKRMRSVGATVFESEIPPEAVRGLNVKYYIEVVGTDGLVRTAVGTPALPVGVPLVQPVHRVPAGRLAAAALAILFLALPIAAVIERNRRRRNDVLDRLFWVNILGPMARLRGEALAEHVKRLADTRLDHPVRGLESYERQEILRKLQEVRGFDLEKLARDRDRQLGPHYVLGIQPVTVPRDYVKENLGPIAADVGRMCVAAWFLSGSGKGEGEPDLGFLEEFEEARAIVHRTRQKLAADQAEEAICLLEELKRQDRTLRTLIDDVDRGRSAEDLTHHLAETVAVTADNLGQLMEYYALVAPSTPETRQKLLVVAVALATHDGLPHGDSSMVRAALNRRKLLRGEEAPAPLPTALDERAVELRRQIGASETSAASDLAGLRAEVTRFENELGPRLAMVAGLSEAVVLERLLLQREATVERAKAASFDTLVSDLKQAVDEVFDSVDPEPETHPEEGDPSAMELLAATEIELRQFMAAGTQETHGFFLDQTEQKAFSNGVDPAWASLVVSSAACRTSIDRFARRYARGRQSPGMVPPSLPAETALALAQYAVQLERDLRDSIENDRVRGHDDRAEETEHLANRLSRARIGLDVLVRMPGSSVTPVQLDREAAG